MVNFNLDFTYDLRLAISDSVGVASDTPVTARGGSLGERESEKVLGRERVVGM